MKGNKRISLLAVLVCVFALVFSLGIMSACGNSETASNEGGQWLCGTTAPAENLGNTGDYYLNTETLTAYVRTADGTWQQTALYSGKGVPQTEGELGDLYLDTESGVLYQKGATWGIVLTLKGQPGRDGVVWFSGTENPKVGDTALKDAYAGDFYLNTSDFSVWQLNADKTKWNPLGSIQGHGTTWFEGTVDPADADLENVYEGDFYYRSTYIDDEAEAGQYRIYRYESGEWVVKATVVVMDLSAFYAPDGESYFQDNGDSVTITHVADGVTDLVVPGELNGKPVKIGDKAFQNDGELTSVTLGEGVTSIGASAFAGCTNLETVEFPDSLRSIGGSAFSGSSIGGDLVLPEGLETIGGAAFKDTKLTTVKVPDSVTSIGVNAFGMSRGKQSEATLTSVELGAGLESVPENCFYYQEKLESVVIKSARTIGESAFDSTSNLKHVELPDNLETIETLAFTGSGIRELSYPASLKEIKRDNIGLHKITIPSVEMWLNLTEYDSYNDNRNMLFCGSRLLPTSDIEPSKYDSEGETKIYVKTGDSETLLTDLVIPESVTEIRSSAFKGYTFLKSVTLHTNVTKINSYAFENCYNLRVVRKGSAAIGITKQSIQNGYIGAYAVKIFDGIEGEIETDTTTVNNFEFYTDEAGKHYLLGATKNDLETLTLPLNYNGESYDICPYAFTSYFSAKSIVFPKGCQIGSMGDYAFSWCAQLTSIKFETGCGIKKIGNHAFSGCTGPRSSLLDQGAILTVTLENGCGVTEIGDYAFSSIPELTTFTVPAAVTRLGTGTFSGCGNLTSVTFMDTRGWKRQFSTLAPTEVDATKMGNATQMAKEMSANGNGYAYFKEV